MLHPHLLDGIWTGQTPYRLPKACLITPLVSIQNIGPEKFQEGVRRGLIIFSDLEKTVPVPDMGGKSCEKKQSIIYRV